MLLTSGKPDSAQVWHLPELDDAARTKRYGAGQVMLPDPLIAGADVTITFAFIVGETVLPVGGRLRIAWRWPLDWANLQATNPAAAGYMQVKVQPDPARAAMPATVVASFQQMGGLDPWMHCIDLTVQTGTLQPGDRVQLVCGDRTGGGQGWRVPTCRVNNAQFLLLVNPDNSDRWLRLADPPRYALQAGPPVRLVATAPAQGVVGEALTLIVRAEDRWGNATSLDSPPQLVVAAQPITVLTAAAFDQPSAYHFSLTFAQPGAYRLQITAPEHGLQTLSNPFRITTERPPQQLFWGDLHSGQTEIGCGAGTLADHYRYARDVAGLQFITHQANDHYMTRADWQQTRDEAIAFDEPGRFAVFLGCEWSPPTVDGGDRNVIYRHDEARLRRSGRFFTEADPDPEPDLSTAPEFHAAFQDEAVMINMHVGGRPTNLAYHLPPIEPLAEIHSTHGTSEWFIEEALQRGYQVGITAGGDGVAGRPGADHPGWRLNRNVRSGLTGVYATALTKEALWEAFHARRCYGTNGERIRLWVEVDGHPMGAAYTATDQPEIKLMVEGTAAIERVDLLRGTDLLCSWQLATYGAAWLRVLWSGARTQGTARAQQLVWDGTLTVDEGRFAEVIPIGLQSADDEVALVDPTTIRWRSTTAGNHAGFRYRLAAEGAANPHFHFASGPATFTFHHNQVQLAPLTIAAAPVKRQVVIGPAPREDGPHRVELSYRDCAPLPGATPYWVRVVQVNQGRAWSSPVYVKRDV
ncbi:MAG: DUF3604 domain-containing protein [Caldilineaceae bacterium]